MTRRRFAQVFLAVVVASLVVVSAAAALRFTDASYHPPVGTVGADYSFTFQGDGGCGPALPYSFKVINGGLPPGLSLSSSGTVSGIPTQAGSYSFWVQLSDENPPSRSWCLPKTAEREFTISIDPGLRIVTNDIPQAASIGEPYSATLQAQLVTSLNPPAGTTPTTLTWNVLTYGTGLPPGLTLGPGVISGTPTTEGAYSFRIQAALDPTHTSFQTYSLTVRQPLTVTPSRPLSTPPAPTLWEVGVPFNAKLTPSGGNGTYTVALAEGALPVGLAVAADGTISGTPSTAGVSRATIRVTDGEGRTLDYVVGFGVARKLAIATRALKPGKVGKLYRSKLTTTGGLPPKTWRAVSGKFPKGVRLDRTLGVLSGIPRKAGSYKVTFEARDGLKVAAQKTLRIIVAP